MSFPLQQSSLALICLLANSCAKAPEKKIWAEFSGEKAFRHVQALVDLGPRPPGSDAIVRARAYVEEQLESSGWTVSEQAFTDRTPRGDAKFVNLIARFGTGTKPVFLLCSHYDTKIFDTFPFVGANDGGSSTGLLLEMARVLALESKLAQKIELVFFDGEEAVENFSQTDGIYGSRHFALDLSQAGAAKSFRGGILFDMVGDRSLDITLPPNSPAKITAGILASADVLQLRNYFTYFEQDITDDHTPLNAIGIPVVDLIDFHYPPWHTAEDTIDKLSPQSLQTVGSVAAYYLSNFAFK
ncbi:MAG TPA: M28 family peptidase [Chthoniobacterales bacterium]|nr:M28 family peptidase [Chthoniobacterales bacterium]